MSVVIVRQAREDLAMALDQPLINLLLDHEWSIFCPDGADEHDAYEHMRRGRCMLCGEVLGEDTVIIVDAQGILGIWCSGNCLVDTHAISFLEQLLADMTRQYDPEERDG